jgi:hypothetical protein
LSSSPLTRKIRPQNGNLVGQTEVCQKQAEACATPKERTLASQEEHTKAFTKIRDGGIATKVRILINDDSCPVCQAMAGAYEFDEAPELPHEGCSHPNGCRCFYAPVLDRRGP